MTDYADMEIKLRYTGEDLRVLAGSEAYSVSQRALFESLGNQSIEAADALASLTRELEEARDGARTMRSRCAEVAREAGRKVVRAARTSDHDEETQIIDAAQIQAAAAIAGMIEKVPLQIAGNGLSREVRGEDETQPTVPATPGSDT